MCSHMEYCALTRAILNILRIFSSPAVVICDTEDGIDVALAPSKRMYSARDQDGPQEMERN